MDAELHLYDLCDDRSGKKPVARELFESTMNGRKEYNPADEARALKIIRYAFEYYLGWTPEQVHANIDPGDLKASESGQHGPPAHQVPGGTGTDGKPPVSGT